MKVYFVRHGETALNAKNYHQDGLAPLSEYGIKQAKSLSRRFKKIPINIIIASDFSRAKLTAEIINKVVKKRIEFSPLLREVKRPTEIENKNWFDPEAIRIKKLIKENRHDPKWHYSDEENFFDHKKRAEEFIDLLSQRQEENILVASHGITIKLIVLMMIFGKHLSLDIFDQVVWLMRLRNTGLILCEKENNGPWQLLTWNDYAHLG